MTTAGANERYVYDGSDVLIDLNADWSVATSYLNDLGIDNHLRQTSTSTGVSYYLTDHLGSTKALADASGNLLEQLEYGGFGNGGASNRTRLGFTGRERDPDTSQVYYRARYYDPQIGRFTSEDPLAFGGGGANFYDYAGNNPILFDDPTGLWSPEAHRYIIHLAFDGCLSEVQMDMLIKQSDYMDGLLNGGAWMEKYAYQHQMRAPNESVDTARNNANGWIAASLREAAAKRQWSDTHFPQMGSGISFGLLNFGQAIHTITDGFSPAHEGFQVWHGPPWPTGIIPLDLKNANDYRRYVQAHAAKESLDVLKSDKARLDRIIKAVRDAFFQTFGDDACDCAK
jgi:RHS repeat-associated protein